MAMAEEQDGGLETPPYRAARMVAKALQAANPVRDEEYLALIRKWMSDEDFRALFDDVAAGLGLRLARGGFGEAVSEEFGVTLVPTSRHSPFSARASDYRAGMPDVTAAMFAIVQAAVLATLYPTRERLDDHTSQPRCRVSDVVSLMEEMIDAAKDRGRQAAEDAPELVEGWRQLDALKARSGKGGRAGVTSREGIVLSILGRLVDMKLLSRGSDSLGDYYRPTHRYRLQARDALDHDLYRFCRSLLDADREADQEGGE